MLITNRLSAKPIDHYLYATQSFCVEFKEKFGGEHLATLSDAQIEELRLFLSYKIAKRRQIDPENIISTEQILTELGMEKNEILVDAAVLCKKLNKHGTEALLAFLTQLLLHIYRSDTNLKKECNIWEIL